MPIDHQANLNIAPETISEPLRRSWPNLPLPIKNGIGIQIGTVAYIGLGTAGRDFYSLKLNQPEAQWIKKSSYIGEPTFGAAAAAVNHKIYIFSGNGKDKPDAPSPIIFDSVYCYDTNEDHWSKLNTKTPVGLSGATALALSDGRIALIGGYNKELFDRYLSELTKWNKDQYPEEHSKLVCDFMGMPPSAYEWNDKVWCYDPASNEWSTLGDNPFLPNCDSTAATIGIDDFIIIGGEIKPGLRTPKVKNLKFTSNSCTWQRLANLPASKQDEIQEGVAGAYATAIGNSILLAGGVNFKGARKQAESGKWYAHQGLTKKWREEIYLYDGISWQEIASLPEGLGYGASFSIPNGLLIVGGEDAETNARSDVFSLTLINGQITVNK